MGLPFGPEFSEAVLKAVNLGDDADTTGAVCGQFAGASSANQAFPLPGTRGLRGVITSKTSCSDFSGTNEQTE